MRNRKFILFTPNHIYSIVSLSSKLHSTSPIILSPSIPQSLKPKAKVDCVSFIIRCYELNGVKFKIQITGKTIMVSRKR